MSKETKIDKSEKIVQLTDYQHARLRTEMYLGSRTPHTQEILIYDKDFKPVLKNMTWVPALFTAFREILDNACDEVIGHKKGNTIWIEYDPKLMVFSVEDNGRGVPINFVDEHNMHMATMALSKARAGRNFQDRGEVAGTNGLGAACTNFCSEWFKLEITRDGKNFVQDFAEGNVLIDDMLTVKKPKITNTTSKTTGTKITFKPSKHVFETVPKLKNNLILPLEFIRSRAIEVAICNPHVTIYFNGEKIKVKNKPEQTLFPTGNYININIDESDFKSKFFLIPNWNPEGEFVHSIVNNIPAFNGGTHIDNFRRTFYKGIISALEKESKRRKLTPNVNDVQFGLLVFNTTTMNAPNFDSQSKTRLINEHAGSYVKKALEDQEIYKAIIRKNKDWIEEIYDRCATRTNKKDLDEINKLSKKVAKAKVARLMDANGKDRSKCVLVLAEGESAIAGMCTARNPELHAGMGLKGKVLNVNDEQIKTVLANKELIDIMNSIGLSIGSKANRLHLRFGKVFLAHDADEDGKNIGALLVNFFYTFWPELFDKEQEPFVYILQTPFLIGEKGKERKYWYAHNYHEYDQVKHKDYKITRAKGLGTLGKEDWKYSLTYPELFAIVDDGNLKETLDLLFNGKRADDRKTWMGI